MKIIRESEIEPKVAEAIGRLIKFGDIRFWADISVIARIEFPKSYAERYKLLREIHQRGKL